MTQAVRLQSSHLAKCFFLSQQSVFAINQQTCHRLFMQSYGFCVLLRSLVAKLVPHLSESKQTQR